jgi:hypothetical protein
MLLTIAHLTHQFRFGWFPLMYYTHGEEKAGGVMCIFMSAAALIGVRLYGWRSTQFRYAALNTAVLVVVAPSIYFTHGDPPRWLLFCGTICVIMVLANLVSGVRGCRRGRFVAMWGFMAVSWTYVILATACYWYAAKVLGQSAAWMNILVDIDDDAAWLATGALGLWMGSAMVVAVQLARLERRVSAYQRSFQKQPQGQLVADVPLPAGPSSPEAAA